jgi:hypothetical protein
VSLNRFGVNRIRENQFYQGSRGHIAVCFSWVNLNEARGVPAVQGYGGG